MTTASPFIAILVAAGRSERMGDDKLWIDFWGRPAWRWSLDVLLASPGLQRVAIAVPANAIDRFRSALAAGDDRCLVVPGGATRADSVIAGLLALTDAGFGDKTVVLVHDAARPAVTPELVSTIADAAAGGEWAVVPVIPVVDSLKRVRDERVVASVARDEVAAAQTPQAARLGDLRAAIEEAHAWGRPVTDDAGALAAAGVSVHTVEGDPANRKLTEAGDLVMMRAVLAAAATQLDGTDHPSGPRSGIGFDAHRLAEGRPMRVGGLSWDGESRGPLGHSDGDAVLHAIIDALLGAANMGDVGTLFPAGEAAWEGVDSADLVVRAVERLAGARWRPTGVDVTVAAVSPNISSRRDELRDRIAGLLGIDRDEVSVKGTTSDGLGFAGDEGIAAWAVATVDRAE
jgi:2-C-methyl-D-erythritol 4-phosphate cytidylyltransferase/2-C-methyl-D-erythritol 2,4-cyclodiphosphate synthase